MSQQLSAILQTARSDLENLAITHLAEYQQRNDEDLHLLLDLCDESHSLPLDDIEQEGVRIAEANDPIDVRLESIERTADAVGAAIDMHFAGIEQMRLYAREQLRRSRRAYIMSLTRGFQNAINLLKTEENERTHLFQERLRALQRVNATINSNFSLEETLSESAKIINTQAHSDLCAIFTSAGAEDLTLRATSQDPVDFIGHYVIHVGEELTGRIAQRGFPAGVADISALGYEVIESAMFDSRFRSIFVIPIIYFANDSNTLEGAITLLSEQPRDYSVEEISFLEMIAGQLAMGLENSFIYSRMDEQFRRQVNSINTLQHISATVASSFDLSRVLELIISQATPASGSHYGAIFAFNNNNALQLQSHYHLDAPGLRETIIRPGECCVGRAMERCDRTWALDCMHTDATCFLQKLSLKLPNAHSSLAIPLVSKGLMHGVMLLLSQSQQIQPYMRAEMVETLAHEAAVAIESTRLYEETLRALEVKSRLLQEMHHRVKNNLLSIAAILRMERRRTTSEEAAKILAESVSRIDGMAATHDLLSREEQIGSASLEDLARKLVGVVSAHLVTPTMKVDFEIRAADKVEVHSRDALALSLILNELIANSIEHGFKNCDYGKVKIGAWKEPDSIHLIIADLGQELADTIDFSSLSSLGLPLVRDITRDQLRGTFTLRRAPLPEFLRDEADDETNWTVAEIIFPGEMPPISSQTT